MKVISIKGQRPIPQGSMSAFGPGIITATNGKKLNPWRKAVAEAYKDQDGSYYEQYTPLIVSGAFYLKRPKVPKSEYPSTKGADLDKLCRAIGDALSGIAYHDDCQIVWWDMVKLYCDGEEEEGVTFQIKKIEENINDS